MITMKVDDIILTSILECKHHELYSKDQTLTEEQSLQFQSMRQRFDDKEPLQYILGEWEFCGTSLYVDPRVLIPRPETEILVEEVIQRANEFSECFNVLNIGVGSANIEIAIARAIAQSHITGVEISADALVVAHKNINASNLTDQITLVHADVCDYLRSVSDTGYDMIVSNPPYICTADMIGLPEDVRQEPSIALDGGADGLDYFRRIILNGVHLLNASGYMLFECGDGQHTAIADLLRKTGVFQEVEFVKDLSETIRIVIGKRK